MEIYKMKIDKMEIYEMEIYEIFVLFSGFGCASLCEPAVFRESRPSHLLLFLSAGVEKALFSFIPKMRLNTFSSPTSRKHTRIPVRSEWIKVIPQHRSLDPGAGGEPKRLHTSLLDEKKKSELVTCD